MREELSAKVLHSGLKSPSNTLFLLTVTVRGKPGDRSSWRNMRRKRFMP